VSNDWAFDAIEKMNPRLVATAQVSTLDIGDAVTELERVAEMGYRAVFMPVKPHPQQEDYNQDAWEPFWAAAEAVRIVVAFHIGTRTSRSWCPMAAPPSSGRTWCRSRTSASPSPLSRSMTARARAIAGRSPRPAGRRACKPPGGIPARSKVRIKNQ
jgi:hypothetical protein